MEESSFKNRLRTHAPFSLIDTGWELGSTENTSNLVCENNQVAAEVRDRFDEVHQPKITLVSPRKWVGRCTCSSAEDMDEQWCVHAVAAVSAAFQQDLIPEALLAEREVSQDTAYRINTTTPDDIARVVRETVDAHIAHEPATRARPAVSLGLSFDDESLGVQVRFDDTVIGPENLDDLGILTARSLDAILIELLDNEGFWDEEKLQWYVHSGKAIATILGLVEEYPTVGHYKDGSPLVVGHEHLEGKITVEWQETSAELIFHWLLPDGSLRDKVDPVVGDGPFWALLDTTIYKLSPNAEKLAELFPFSSTLSVSRSSTGALIEIICSTQEAAEFLEVLNPAQQPQTQVTQPAVTLDLKRVLNTTTGGFRADGPFEVTANFTFDYPQPGEGENLVFMPDRSFELAQEETLTSLGFSPQKDTNRFKVDGDAALELFYSDEDQFPEHWDVRGTKEVTSGLKFANLTLSMTVEASEDEATDSSRGIDWFECKVKLTQNNAQIPISTLFKSTTQGYDRWIQLDSGAYARVPGGGLQQLKTSLGILEPNYQMATNIETKLSTAQAIGFTTLGDANLVVTMDERARNLREKLQEFEKIKAAKPPRTFKGDLRPYQEHGLSWMAFLREFGLDGILADEMGLGKTVQTLALLNYVKATVTRDKGTWRPAMIVAPTSVITNWLYEAKRFTPDFKVLLLHGPQRKKHFNDIAEHDLVITSYALMRLDRFELERHHFSYLVLDEAQNIKNPQAATTRAAKSIRADRRLALTGTPTENRPLELWSILDFLMPGYLGSLDFFRTQVERPIMENTGNNDVTKFLNHKTRPFILRRLKSQVEKELPPKIESVVHVPMRQSQQQLYAQILEEVRPRIFEAIEEKGIRGASISILSALLRLRQVCNHPRSIEAFKANEEFESGKFELLKDLVTEALESGRKLLLFSQFREMLSIIRTWLESEGVNHLYLDGATRNRQDLVEKFNSDESTRLFLISLKAGGTGLNLTAADTVVIYDPWWNPAVELQAVDRAHRIGQTRPVNVYRLVTEDSIEQKIMELKSRKAQMVEALINENGLSTASLTKEDLESFFSPLPVTPSGS